VGKSLHQTVEHVSIAVAFCICVGEVVCFRLHWPTFEPVTSQIVDENWECLGYTDSDSKLVLNTNFGHSG
jgi:hypothetical protein